MSIKDFNRTVGTKLACTQIRRFLINSNYFKPRFLAQMNPRMQYGNAWKKNHDRFYCENGESL